MVFAVMGLAIDGSEAALRMRMGYDLDGVTHFGKPEDRAGCRDFARAATA